MECLARMSRRLWGGTGSPTLKTDARGGYHVIQDLPFGQRYLKLSNGEVLETPNAIRTMIPQWIADQYRQYCTETNFIPFSESTMLRILSSCSASVRKSLQGLDYLTADGTKAIDDLAAMVEKLGDYGQDREWVQQCGLSLKRGKQYLKSDYKVIGYVFYTFDSFSCLLERQ